MDIALLLALAPAIAAFAALVVVEAPPAVKRAKAALDTRLIDVVFLETLAEYILHLSTYGSVIVGAVLYTVVDLHEHKVLTAVIAVVWVWWTFRLVVFIKRWTERLKEKASHAKRLTWID